MKTIQIRKFEVNPQNHYYTYPSSWFVFVTERNGKDITFAIENARTRDKADSTAVQAKIVEHNGKVCESARILAPDGWRTIYADEAICGRRLSELPKEKRESIEKAIALDVEFRKKHPESQGETTELVGDTVRIWKP